MGGNAVLFGAGGSLTSSGAVTGGAGGAGGAGGGIGGAGGAGGAGVVSGGSLTNSSGLAGGNGGNGGNGGGVGGNAGAGGDGVLFSTGGVTFNNSGGIIGGNGGNAGDATDVGSLGGDGGAGGAGVQFSADGALTNSGAITGGAGGGGGSGVLSAGVSGAGGAGVSGANLTIINSGAITGGLSGDGLTRAAAIVFTGGTNTLELQAGSNIIGNVAAFSAADTFRLGGIANASFDISLIGTQYQNFGIFQKTGSSTWTLTGTNAAALPWTINAGTLSVNGTMANATMSVNSGGTLGGNGTVGNTTINGGTLAPGNSIGTITVNGNLTFNSASIYLVEVSPTSADRTNVTGAATLAGTVNAIFGPGSYTQHSYTILSAAGGLGGTTFDALSSSSNFSANLSYTPTDVLFNLTAATLGGGTTLTLNQQNVANAINGFFNGGRTLPPGFGTLFGLTGQNLAGALSQLSGESRNRRTAGSLCADGAVSGRHARPLRLWQWRHGRRPGGGICKRASAIAGRGRFSLRQSDENTGPSADADLRAALGRVGRRIWRLQPHRWRLHGG